MNGGSVLQVTNITHQATHEDLGDLFSVAGEVTRCVIINTGFPYYGFVEYRNPETARRALNLNGKFFGASKISVSPSNQPFPQQALPLLGNAPMMGRNGPGPMGDGFNSAPPNNNNNNQFPFIREGAPERRSLRDGPPVQDRLSRKPPPCLSANKPQIVQLNSSNMVAPGQVVQLNTPLNTPGQLTELTLTNIPVTLKEHNLHQMFSEFGTVAEARIITDASGLATGKGSVSLTSFDSAARAASVMNGKQIEGSFTRLFCVLKENNMANQGGPPAGRQRDLRTSLSGNRNHPYNNPHHNAPPPPNSFNSLNPPGPPMQMQQQGPPPQQFGHQHFDPRPEQSSFNVCGGSQHNLTPSPNAPNIQCTPAAIYVGNLPETSCRNCLLYQLFAPYGAVTSVKAMDSKKDNPKFSEPHWFGFVNFKDINCANVAILTLDKSTLDGNIVKVVMKQEKPRGAPGGNKDFRGGNRGIRS